MRIRDTSALQWLYGRDQGTFLRYSKSSTMLVQSESLWTRPRQLPHQGGWRVGRRRRL